MRACALQVCVSQGTRLQPAALAVPYTPLSAPVRGQDRALSATLSAMPAASIEMEFFKLPVFGLDVAHGAGDRAHHHGLGLDDVLAEFHARQQRTCGDAGRREQAVAARHVLDAI